MEQTRTSLNRPLWPKVAGSSPVERTFPSVNGVECSKPVATLVIPLSRGKTALIDADAPLSIRGQKWSLSGRGYATSTQVINGKRRQVYLHRAVTSATGGFAVDHINGNPLDNRRANLRVCLRSQNSGNYRKPKTNTSGFKGVTAAKPSGWKAQIRTDGRLMKHLGVFKTAAEAARAYDRAATEKFGEFAKLNLTWLSHAGTPSTSENNTERTK